MVLLPEVEVILATEEFEEDFLICLKVIAISVSFISTVPSTEAWFGETKFSDIRDLFLQAQLVYPLSFYFFCQARIMKTSWTTNDA